MLERGHYPELQRLFTLLDREDSREDETDRQWVGAGHSGAKKRGYVGRGGHVGKRERRAAAPFALGGRSPISAREGVEWSLPVEWNEKPEDAFMDDGDDDNDDDDDDGSSPMDDDEKAQAVNEGGDVEENTSPPDLFFPSDTLVPRAATIKRDLARQSYVFSATLTLGASGRQQRRKKNGGKAVSTEDPVAKIMKRVGLRGEPAVIDMGRRSAVVGESGVEEVVEGGAEGSMGGVVAPPALPSSLRLCSIKSLQVCAPSVCVCHG